jgi:DNA replication protein DnaC
MKLDAMAAAWAEQSARPGIARLSFDERFGLLVDAEWLHRGSKRLGRVLREAKLRIGGACIEDIEHDGAVTRQLASCRRVVEHQDVLITGASSTGRTYVACALAQQACRKGHRAAYRRASRLFSEVALARADGT